MKKIFLLFALAITVITPRVYAQKNNNKQKTKTPMVLISTDYGNITLKLYDETPGHRDNFIKVVNSGYLDSTLFHRIISSFMIQGGEPDPTFVAQGKMKSGSEYTIPAEINDNLYHKKGALAAARMGDMVNPTKASSGTQFYIVQGRKYSEQELNGMEAQMAYQFPASHRLDYTTIGGTPFLDRNYTVFGEVVEGLDVIDKIAAAKTGPGDRPASPIKMKVTLIK